MDDRSADLSAHIPGKTSSEASPPRELHALIDLTAALGASTDLDISLRVLLERMVPTFGADGGECRLLASGDVSTVLAQRGLDPAPQAVALRRDVVQELSEHAFRRREPIYLSDFGAAELTPGTGFHALLCVPLLDGQKPLGTFVLYYREPREFVADERALLAAIGKQLAINVARARLYEAERAHAQRLRRSHTLVASLSRAAAGLQAVNRTEDLIDTLARELQRLHLRNALLMPAAEADTWRVRHLSLLPSTLLLIRQRLGVDLPRAQFRAGDIPRLMPLLERGTALLVRSVPRSAPRWMRQIPSEQLDQLLQLAGLTAQSGLIALPLKIDGHVEGLLLLWGSNISKENVPAFSIFGYQVAAALRAVRLREQVAAARDKLRRLTQQIMNVQEEERARISRELHDEAGQALTALKIELTLLANDLAVSDPALHPRLHGALEQVDDLLASIRRMAHEMHPPALETLGLNATLEGYCETFGRRTQILVQYDGDPRLDSPSTMAIALYRFLQEALTNVVRHAAATDVAVQLARDDHLLSLTVRDNGCGFDAERQASGLGLAGMRERIEAMGGRLEIESQLDVGTTLTARVPFLAEQ